MDEITFKPSARRRLSYIEMTSVGPNQPIRITNTAVSELRLTEPGASFLPLSGSSTPPADGSQDQDHVAEEDHGRRQPRPVLVGHDVAVAVVLPQLVGCRGHVKVDVAVNQSQQTVTSKQLIKVHYEKM